MKVFISWSGEQSHALAKALHEWLPLVLHYAEPWLSQADINAGDRWGPKVAEELATTNFGIICITKDNINAPWLLFEAGALAKSLEDGKVIPLLLDIDEKEISYPLAQFQAKKAEKNGIVDVISAINKCADSPVPDVRLSQLFEPLWNSLESKILAIPKKEISSKQKRAESEILEELVSGVRSLEVRLRDGIEGNPTLRRRRIRSPNHPEAVIDFSRKVLDDPKDPMQILLISSLLKEDTPWLYELGVETYKTLKSGNIPDIRKACKRIIRAAEVFRHSPFMDDISNKYAYIVLHEISYIMESGLKEWEDKNANSEKVKKNSLEMLLE